MGQVGKPSEYIGFSTHNNIIIMFKQSSNQPNYPSPLSFLFLRINPKNQLFLVYSFLRIILKNRYEFNRCQWHICQTQLLVLSLRHNCQNCDILYEAHLSVLSFRRSCQGYLVYQHYRFRESTRNTCQWVFRVHQWTSSSQHLQVVSLLVFH